MLRRVEGGGAERNTLADGQLKGNAPANKNGPVYRAENKGHVLESVVSIEPSGTEEEKC